MNIVSRLVLVAAVIGAGCAQPQAHAEHPAAPAAAPVAAAAAAAPSVPAAAGPRIDRSGSVEQQLRRLQDAYDHDAEAIAFLNQVYAQQKAQQAQRDSDEPADDAVFAVDVTGDIALGQVDGPASAPVTIIKAFDFACPYCQRTVATLEELVKEYGGKVRVVYTNLLIHPPAKPAHLASCAAAKQGKYMAFKDAFWDQGFGPYAASAGKDAASLGEDSILKIAKGVGLDTRKLKTDMASAECAARLEGDMAELAKFHVNATPTFFVNGKFLSGALPKDEFKRVIDAQLAIAEASGVPGAEYYRKVVLAKGEKQFRSKVDPKH